MSLLLWGFGANHAGQLGIDADSPDSNPTPKAVRIPNIASLKPRKMACGKTFSILLSENGSTVMYTGRRDAGNHQKSGRLFEKMVLPPGVEVSDAAVGDSFAAFVTKRGELFSCGHLDSKVVEDRARFFTIRPVEVLISHHVINVSVGSGHVVALSASGQCFSWGKNEKGQLGLGNMVPFIAQPQEIKSVTGVPVKQVTAGGYHSFILSMSGAMFSFGSNSAGQLGLGDEEDREYPTLVKFLRSQFVMYMAAGEQHSAALTADGGVFTFGSGKFGQLGHNSTMNENIPRKIMELMGSYVIQVACGQNHTMTVVRAASPRLFACGQGSFGQLGVATEGYSNFNAPVLSRAAMDVVEKASPKQRIRSIYAGGDSCFLVTEVGNGNNSHCDLTSPKALPPIYHLTLASLKQLLSADSKDIETALSFIFRSASCLNASFLLPGNDHFRCSSTNCGVSMSDARHGWYLLLTSSRTCRSPINQSETVSVGDLVLSFISRNLLPTLARSPPDVEALRLYLILPANARFENPENYATLQCPFAASVTSLERPAGRVLSKWWAKISREDFAKLVAACKKCSIHIMRLLAESKSGQLLNPIAAMQSGKDFDAESRTNLSRLQSLLEMLKLLSRVNEDMRRSTETRLDCDQFYIPEIREHSKVSEAYIAWWHSKQKGQHESLFNLCNYPFIFDAKAKSILLETDAKLQMHYAVESARRQAIVNIFIPFVEPENPFLTLTVHRNNIVIDTVQQLGLVSKPTDYKKPLKVSFVGEEGDDAGGVRKEFFLLLFKEVFDPKYGMFRSDEISRLNWFNDILDDEESINMYQFIGLLCGLAIYNSTIVDISFPTALFKKLLNKPCNLDDLKELSPTIGRSLEQLLEFEGPGSVEDVFSLNFEITRTRFDTVEAVELVPGGTKKAVTAENRSDYVEAYVDYVFNKSVQRQFEAYMRGFDLVCSGNVFSMFHPSELQALVIGNENYDWDEFEKNAEYKGEFYAKHPTIIMFWQIFHELHLEDKKKFLMFLSGSDRVPILGMQAVKIIFQPVKVADTFLPVAHTCFGLLDLPIYKDKETLKEKLLASIQHTRGFGIA